MARSTNTAAARCGGPEFIVSDETGILVAPENVAALAEAMLEMVAVCQNYDAEKIRQAAMERFSERAVGQKLAAIYQKQKTANRY